MSQLIDADSDHQRLAAAVVAALAAAEGSAGRAVVLDRIAESLITAIVNDPSVPEDERTSILHVLDAADEHCQRMGGFAITT